MHQGMVRPLIIAAGSFGWSAIVSWHACTPLRSSRWLQSVVSAGTVCIAKSFIAPVLPACLLAAVQACTALKLSCCRCFGCPQVPALLAAAVCRCAATTV